ncbi:hypothetical protein DsansV1_C01g0012901 [Dioscorea sansibarensis]
MSSNLNQTPELPWVTTNYSHMKIQMWTLREAGCFYPFILGDKHQLSGSTRAGIYLASSPSLKLETGEIGERGQGNRTHISP